MLLKFICKNYRSFKDEVTLDMLASPDASHETHVITPPEAPHLRVLRFAAIYGANASGKSNLIHAISAAQKGVLENALPPYRPFRLNAESLNLPTRFEFYLLANQHVYNYGFAYDDVCVREEWLYRTEKSKEIELFTRTAQGTTHEADITTNARAFQKGDREKLSVIASMTRPDQLFLRKAFENNVTTIQPIVRAIDAIECVWPSSQFAALKKRLHSDPPFRNQVAQFLAGAGTGVAGIDVQVTYIPNESPESDLLAWAPDEAGVMVRESRDERIRANTLWNAKFRQAGKDDEAPIPSAMLQLVFEHSVPDDADSMTTFLAEEESDGTLRLLHLAPMILPGPKATYCVDELDRSLHPLLARHVLQTATEQLRDTVSQIIFSTHESHLLDLDLLRRDEIWFTEKDPSQSTTLYSLAEFKARKDLRIEKGYLQGRFGAIPFLAHPDAISFEE